VFPITFPNPTCLLRTQALMEKAEYPEFKNHRQIHNDFLAKLKTLKAPLDDAVIAWTKKWWAPHFAQPEMSTII